MPLTLWGQSLLHQIDEFGDAQAVTAKFVEFGLESCDALTLSLQLGVEAANVRAGETIAEPGEKTGRGT